MFSDNDYRYLRDDETHYKLDFRMVLTGVGGIDMGFWGDSMNGLKEGARTFLGDFITVANNLGFDCEDDPNRYDWKPGKRVDLTLSDGNALMDAKAHKNGNLHIRVAKNVLLAINVQAGKLLGWIHSPEQAIKELGVSKSDENVVRKAFAMTNQITASQLMLTA